MQFGFKHTVKALFDVKSWVAWDSMKSNASMIHKSYGLLLGRQKRSFVKETFDEAIEKYGYTESFLKEQQAKFEQAATVYFGILFISVCYTIWLVHTKSYMASIVMIPFMLMIFSFYFRESFWALQIRKRKLGLTFMDWLNGINS